MGACGVVARVEAKSPNAAFKEIRAKDLYNYGNDPYNGSFTTICGFTVTKAFPKYSNTEKRKKEVERLVDSMWEKLRKRESVCIDLGIKRYERVTAREIRKEVTAKYAQRYVLETLEDFEWIDRDNAEKKTVLQAKAKKWLANGAICRIVKKPVLLSGENVSSSFEIEVKKFSSRPKEVKGTVEIREIHEYVFVGLAAC